MKLTLLSTAMASVVAIYVSQQFYVSAVQDQPAGVYPATEANTDLEYLSGFQVAEASKDAAAIEGVPDWIPANKPVSADPDHSAGFQDDSSNEDECSVSVQVDTEANSSCGLAPGGCDCEGYLYEFTVLYTGPDGVWGGAYDYHDNTYGAWSLQNGETYTFNVSNSNHEGEDHDHNDPMMWTYVDSWEHHGTYDATCGESQIGEGYGPFTLIGFVDVNGNVCGGSTGCNGVADINPTSGEAPYTYLWSDGATSEDRDDLCTGTYQVTVTDTHGCSSVTDVEIEDNSPTIDVTVITGANTSCGSAPTPPETDCACEGKMRSFTLEYLGVSGATVTAYDDDDDTAILVATFANVQYGDVLYVSAENLPGGDFEAKSYMYTNGGEQTEIHTSCSQNIVGDTEGNFYIIGYTDGQGEQCGVSGEGIQDGCNGTAHVTASAGEAPYTYLWSDGSTAQTRDNLCGGTYQVTVTDANGCSATVDVVVENDTPTIDVTVTTGANTSCGSAPTPPETDCACEGKMRSFTLEYLGVSGATVTAYDDDDDTAILVATFANVQYGDVLYVSAESLPGGDFEAKSYMYTNGGEQTEIHTSCSQNIVGDTEGNFYIIGYTDGQGEQCGVSGEGIQDGCNGTAHVTASAGEAPYTYLWSDGSTAQTRDNLCGGTYQVTVTDANGCSATVDVVVENDTPTIDVTVTTGANTSCGSAPTPPETDCACEGKMRSFTLEYLGVSGATVTAYDDDDDTAILVATFANVQYGDVLYVSAESLPGGDFEAKSYMYTNGGEQTEIHTSCSQNIVGDTEGNFYIIGYTDGQGEQCGVSGEGIQDGCNGTAHVTASAGEAPYTYLWSDGSTAQTRDNLCGGTYQVTVTDANGCSATVDVVVENDPNVVTVVVTSEDDTNCDDEVEECVCEGYLYEFTVLYTGPDGVFGGAYDYHDNDYGSWTLQNGQTYTFNSSNCNHPDEDHYHNDPMMWTYEGEWEHHGTIDATCGHQYIGETFGDFTLVGYVDSHGNVCNGANACNGTADVTASNGEAPYTYVWSDGSTAEDRTNLCAGTYTVEVTDASGCMGMSTVEIGQGSPLELILTATDTQCPDTCDGSATVVVDGGSGNYEIEWSNGGMTASIADLCAGLYSVTVTDGNCTAMGEVTVSEGDLPTPTVTITCPADTTVYSDENCSTNTSVDALGMATAAGSGSASFALGDVASFDIVTNTDGAGCYTIERTWTVSATDACGLTATATCTQTIMVKDIIDPVIHVTDTDAACGPDYGSYTHAQWEALGGGTATDNCDDNVTAHVTSAVFHPDSCYGFYTLHWSAGDECDNHATATQVIDIFDTTPPTVTITCPSDTVVYSDADCYSNTTIAALGTATAVGDDNCDFEVSDPVSFDIVTNTDGAGCYTIERTWSATATDACGLTATATCTQTIMVKDIIDPVIHVTDTDAACGPDYGSYTHAQWEALGGGTATDNCDDNVTAHVTSAVFHPDSCYGFYTLHWSAGDECDNHATATQVIDIFDTTPPTVTITCPSDTVVYSDADCYSNTTIAALGTATAVGDDNCDFEVSDPVSFDIVTNTDGAGCYTIERTWSATATDACGLTATATCTQTIMVKDIIAPVIHVTDTEAACGPDYGSYTHAQWEALGGGTATDNCDDNVTAHVTSAVFHPDSCYGFYTLHWSAGDECDNHATATQVIDIFDTTPPTVTITCPSDTVVYSDADCYSNTTIAALGTATAVGDDNCDFEVSDPVSFDIVTNTDGAGCYTIERTWSATATDACGLTATATCTQTIMVKDIIAPVIHVTDTEAACGPDYGSYTHAQWEALGGGTATDNCDDNVTAHVTSAVFHPDSCYGFYTLHWSAGDECDNHATATQVIDIFDTTPPTVTITCPSDTVVYSDADCYSNTTIAALGTATAVGDDNCDFEVSDPVSFDIVTNTDGAGCYTIERTWSATATDACGLTATATCTQTIMVKDIIDPVIHVTDTEAACGPDYGSYTHAQWEALGGGTATDNCDDNVTAHVTSAVFHPDSCYGFYTLHWSAGDECDNHATATQVIDIFDTTPPTVTITCPSDTVVYSDADCYSNTTIAALGTATAVGDDNCDFEVSDPVSFDIVTNTDGAGCYTIERTWTVSATDACGLTATATCTQTIMVKDIIAPVIHVTDTDAACGPDYGSYTHAQWEALGGGTATDNCDDNVTAHVTSAVFHPDSCYGFYTLHWSAGDECDNHATATQVIDIFDTTPPTVTITCPSDTVVYSDADCYSNTTIAALGTATAVGDDNCDFEVSDPVSFDIVTNTDGAGCYTIERTWSATATDACGLTATATCTQTIMVKDIIAPEIQAADTSFECEPGNNFYPDLTLAEWADLVEATASDNCNDLEPSLESVAVGGPDSCTTVYTLTWVAMDDCENETTEHQLVTITDTTAPVVEVTCAADTTVVSDMHCNVDLPMDPPTYVITDCDSLADVHISHEVETILDLTYSDDDVHEGCYTVVQTWSVTATDWCGQSTTATCDRNIHVEDQTAPVFTGDVLIDISCDEWEQYADSILVQATDNCDSEVTITLEQDMASGVCPESYLRHYTAVDDCGNHTVFEQIIRVFDWAPPTVTIDCPDTLEVWSDSACLANISPAVGGEATTTIGDNCDPNPSIESVTYMDSDPMPLMAGDDASPEGCSAVERTWKAVGVDRCGNRDSVTCVQVIMIYDTVAPAFNLMPESITVGCDETYDVALPVAEDNCDSEVNQSCSNEIAYTLPGCPSGYVDTWTCVANDDCGNSTSITWSYTIVDEHDPELTVTCGEPVTVYKDGDCHVVLPTDEPTVHVSDCDPDVEVVVTGPVETVTPNDDEADDDTPEGCYTVSQLWSVTATDCSGNSTTETCTRMVTVMDTIAPVFPSTPESLVLDCSQNYDAGIPIASDNCDTDVAQSCSNEIVYTLEGCLTCYVDTWSCTASDDCGNTSTITWSVTVTDDNAPELIIECQDSLTMYNDADCHVDLLASPPLYGVNDCDPNVEVEVTGPEQTFVPEDVTNIGCYTVYQTWTVTATDCKGNSTSEECHQVISVLDTIAPVITCPADTTVPCNTSMMPDITGYATAVDGCSEVVITYSDEVEESVLICDTVLTVIRTWVAVDECENMSTCVQYIEENDLTPPQITFTGDLINGEVIELCCSEPGERISLPDPIEITYEDDCGASASITELRTGTVPGDTYLTCAMETPEAFDDGETCTGFDPHSLRLFGFPDSPNGTAFFSNVTAGEVVYQDDETWTVSITVVNNSRADAGFDVSITYSEGMGWEDWISRGVPSSYKLDCGQLPDEHEEWMYFILQQGTFTGWGAYEGSSFSLTHQPVSEFFGCQVGLSANNMNANYGFSSWLLYNGTMVVDGESFDISSSGDIFGDLDCCLPFSVERTYLVQDCAGNSSTFSYTIARYGVECPDVDAGSQGTADSGHTPVIVTGNGDLVGNKTPIAISTLMPNPTGDFAEVRFTVNQPMRVRADLTDMGGELVDQLFDAPVQPGATYTIDLDVQSLANGMYQVRLVSNNYLTVRKLLVNN